MGITIEKAITRYKNNAEYERTHGDLQGCLEFRQLAEWLKELKQLREQTGWIPVSERMPEDFGTYLITLKNGDECLCDFNPNSWADRTGLSITAIAWMPFKSYKAKEGKYDSQESEGA